MPSKPNVLFFFTDDQRFDTIRALGTAEIHTPNLDALVANGTTFVRAHIPSGTCGAVCMPSRAMLHSGRTLFHIEGLGQTIPESHITLGECLRNDGYETFGVGKWHNGKESFARSFSSGDEIYFGGMFDHWNVPVHRYDPTGKYDSKIPYVKDPARSNTLSYNECDHINAGYHSTDLFTDATIRFLEERDKAHPFFAYVSLMAPHDPRTMPERFLNMYNPDDVKLPENFASEHAIDTGALLIRDEVLAAFPRDPAEIRRHIAEYYAMITHLDDAFGRLIAALKDAGEFDNTIIIFAGDNGLAVGQHGLMGKQNLYEHSVRIPLIFSGPGIPQNQKSNALVYLLDIFPTLCDLIGMEKPASVEGKSFAQCITGQQAELRDSLYLAYGNTIRGLSDGRCKLIEYACGATQLFDLTNDPLEMNSLADDASHAGAVADMRRKLVATADEWDDETHPTGSHFWSQRPDLKNIRPGA